MRLNDKQYRDFLTDGYVVVQPSALDDADHDHYWRRGQELWARARTLKSPTAHLEIVGDNLRAQIPEIDKLLADPALTDAINSILGEDYFLHPHHFVHEALQFDQPFHQDGNLPWNERGHYRSHRPDWLILFYYPQAVHADNGPTEVVLGTQYWTRDIEREDGGWYPGDAMDRSFSAKDREHPDLTYRDRRLAEALENLGVPDLERRFIHVPKGAAVLANYDIVHRGSRKTDASQRFMYKFYFARTREPCAPTWRNKSTHPRWTGLRQELKPVVNQIWHWSRGAPTPIPNNPKIDEFAERLQNGREDEKVAAAYELGAVAPDARYSKIAVAALAQGIHHITESTRRASSYGLRASGSAGLASLVDATGAESVSTRRFGVYGLGHVHAANSSKAVTALIRALTDGDDLVRSNAAYSLGQISRAKHAPRRIVSALVERLGHGIEADNTDVAGLPRSTVRQSIAYAVLLYSYNHGLPARESRSLAEITVDETDRYVAGMLSQAIARALGPKSPAAALIESLLARRWNPPPPIETEGLKDLAGTRGR